MKKLLCFILFIFLLISYSISQTCIHPHPSIPVNGANINTLTPTLIWTPGQTINNITTLHVAINPLFENQIIQLDFDNSVISYSIPSGILQQNVTYFWRLSFFCIPEGQIQSEIYYFTTSLVGLSMISAEIPDIFNLFQNYPNPFNPNTKIKFDVPNVVNGRDRSLRLVIYDALGREAVTLVNEQLQPGTYEAEWDASNYPSGVYFYRLETNTFSETKKMVLIK